MRARQWSKWALALAALGWMGPARAGPPLPPLPPPLGESLERDARATVRARQALAADPELGPLNLSVWVRRGTATLWGPVPSAEAGRRAARRVSQVEGVEYIRNEFYVSARARPRDELVLSLPEPTRTEVASPDRETEALPRALLRALAEKAAPPDIGPGEGLPPMASTRPAAKAVQPVSRESVAPAPPPRARLLPPVPLGPAPAVEPLAAAVERVRRGEARFVPVRATVSGSTVTLRPGEAAGEDVTALAQALRRLPGVTEVLIRSE
jgi:hypothetical protein